MDFSTYNLRAVGVGGSSATDEVWVMTERVPLVRLQVQLLGFPPTGIGDGFGTRTVGDSLGVERSGPPSSCGSLGREFFCIVVLASRSSKLANNLTERRGCLLKIAKCRVRVQTQLRVCVPRRQCEEKVEDHFVVR